MKFNLTFVAALAVALNLHAAEGEGGFLLDGLLYEVVDENSVAVAAGENTEGHIVIPSSAEIDGKSYAVTSVKDEGFMGCNGITEVSFPSSITTIGSKSFRNCKNLTALHGTDHVTTLGKECFSNCSALQSIEFSQVQTVPENAFCSCSAVASVSMPSVETINDGAFQSCELMESADFSDSLYWIGERAFMLCWSLKRFNIPAGCIINTSAFYSAQSLDELVLPYQMGGLGETVFSGCSHLYSIYLLCENYPELSGATDDGILDYVEGRKIYCAPALADYLRANTDNDIVDLNTIMRPVTKPSAEDEFIFSLDPITIPGNPIEGPITVRQPGQEGDIESDAEGNYTVQGDTALISWVYYGIRLTYYIHKTASTSAITDIATGQEQSFTIYTLDGRIAGHSQTDLAPGLYIVNDGLKVRKLHLH